MSVGGGTATSGTDYAAVSDVTITIAKNATTATGTFTLTPTQDTLAEGDETITIAGPAGVSTPATLTPTDDTSVEDTESISIDGMPESRGANFTVGGTAIMLTDNDAQPAVTLTATPSSVDEAALATSMTVKATAASTVAWARTVTVSVGQIGSAASGTDYAAVSNFEIAIAANALSGTGTFTLKPIQDTTNEGNETIGVAGTSLNTTVTGTTVTLADDDINPAVTLSVSPASVLESAYATTCAHRTLS